MENHDLITEVEQTELLLFLVDHFGILGSPEEIFGFPADTVVDIPTSKHGSRHSQTWKKQNPFFFLLGNTCVKLKWHRPVCCHFQMGNPGSGFLFPKGFDGEEV